jgi:two-component system response regulator ResD
MRILLVEDDSRIARPLALDLRHQNHTVDIASDGVMGLEFAEAVQYELILLDLMLPKMDGITLCKQLRANGSNSLILMLTARDTIADKVIGLDAGADDYLVKPFSTKELVARVKALLRRSTGQLHPVTSEISAGLLHIDKERHRVSIGDEVINLTPLEFDLLYFLAKNRGRVFTREQLMETVWGYDFYGDARTVDTHVKKLREKLTPPEIKKMLVTVWGVGYKFDPDSAN